MATPRSDLDHRAAVRDRFGDLRGATRRLCAALDVEWQMVQADARCSPTKWHLAHTTWFFERLVLAEHVAGYRPFPFPIPADRLFNSYYQAIGPQLAQDRRSLLASPSLDEVLAYRSHVDAAMADLLAADPGPDVLDLIVLGIAHEEQHQELIVTDQLAARRGHPLLPAWPGLEADAPVAADPGPLAWLPLPREPVAIGAAASGFAYDNERPRHEVLLQPAEIADRLVTCGEYQVFMAAGGYDDPQWWCDDGWQCRRTEQWTAPGDWFHDEHGEWRRITAAGVVAVDAHAPVTHLSWYEADAYARWAGARLPTEFEWEAVAADRACAPGAHLEDGRYRPAGCGGRPGEGLRQALGDCWEWTGSAYRPYPGFRPYPGAAGEYNGKFMINTMVLRGSSCATPRRHARISYRNFFTPDTRWQFAGLRLARDL